MDEEIKRWFEKAKRDLEVAEYLFNGHKYEECSFFSQQSVEKSLKALILKKEKRIIKTHDLLFLAEKVDLPVELKLNCRELTVIYTYVRYPDTTKLNDIEIKAQRYTNTAREVLIWVQKQL